MDYLKSIITSKIKLIFNRDILKIGQDLISSLIQGHMIIILSKEDKEIKMIKKEVKKERRI